MASICERMKVLSIVGARPQFIKLAPLHVELKAYHDHVIVHTGQHYDYEMSQIFFEDLHLPEPDYNLAVGPGSHAEQTAHMLIGCERVLRDENPDVVVVYGDTNSTLAGALAAAKLNLPVAHVEAGLRSYNRAMPEEINRVLTDHLSTMLFCPSPSSVMNLKKEGIQDGVFLVGDIMMECLSRLTQSLSESLLEEIAVRRPYILCTVHRQENADSRENMEQIVKALVGSGREVVFPVHPRSMKNLKRWGLIDDLRSAGNVMILPPQGFIRFTALEKYADVIITDSGGVQKEAYFFGVPCITLRNETEWVETVEEGWNVLTGADRERILEALAHPPRGSSRTGYGKDNVSGLIRRHIESYFLSSSGL